MSATSWPLIASPSPVPPYFREVDVSAWTNGWKISVELVGRDAVAGVGDLEADDRVVRVAVDARARRVTRTTISPALRELDRVADQVGQDLAHPAGVAADHASAPSRR